MQTTAVKRVQLELRSIKTHAVQQTALRIRVINGTHRSDRIDLIDRSAR